MTLKSQLLTLAAAWRKKAKYIEDKFQPINKPQADIASTAFIICAEEIEELANAQPD